MAKDGGQLTPVGYAVRDLLRYTEPCAFCAEGEAQFKLYRDLIEEWSKPIPLGLEPHV